MKVNIKTSNYWAIKDFSMGNDERIHGDKLIALYSLIQKKGKLIKGDNQYNHLKALEFSDNEFIAIEYTPFNKNGNFYPCKLKTIILTTL